MRARDNPFAVHRVLRERYRFTEAEWDAIVASFASRGFRGSIVGPHGSGKTTLLEDLGDRLARRGYPIHLIRLGTENRAPELTSQCTPGALVLCDGAEQLRLADRARLRWWARRARGLIVTCHDERWPPVLLRCSTTPILLRELVAALGVSLTHAEAEQLHRRHAGNVRDAMRELYDGCAAL